MVQPYKIAEACVEKAEFVSSLRLEVKRLASEAMRRISVTRAMELAMTLDGEHLRIGRVTYAMAHCRKIVIVAVGKAAVPMCHTALRIVQPVVSARQNLCGVVVGPDEAAVFPKGFTYFSGGHPLPNAASLQSAEAAIQMLSELESNDLVLFLVSGGASAMMESAIVLQGTTSFRSADQRDQYFKETLFGDQRWQACASG
jgi:glycerate 2-kinase